MTDTPPAKQHPSSLRRKPIFDGVRKLLKRGFHQTEVNALDAAIDSAVRNPDFPPQDSVPSVSGPSSGPRPDTVSVPRILKPSQTARVIGPDGVALIKRFEGCARLRKDGLVEAYPDPGTGGDPWTIGWGATGPEIARGLVWTQDECDARLERDLVRYAGDVSRAIGDAPTSQAQFDALVSFHYNTGAIARATLTKKHIAGDFEGAAREFARWNKAGGKVLKGLVRRRAEEARLYTA